MHGPAHRHALAKPPLAPRRPHTTTWHGVELVDDYAWLRDDNWQEVMRDPERARTGDPRLPRGRERLLRRRCCQTPKLLQADAVRRDEGAHQGGRQLGARARRALRLLLALRDRRPVSAALPAPARRRGRERAARRQRGGQGQAPTGTSARSHHSPDHTLLAYCRRRPGLRALHRPHPRSGDRRATWPTRSPTRAAASSGPTTAARCSTSGSTRTTGRCKVFRHVVGTPGDR